MLKSNKIIQYLNSNLTEYILLSLIIVIGFSVRLYKINSPLADWHSWRQADTASVTRIFVNEGVNVFLPKFYDISSIQSRIFNPNGYRMVEFPVYNLIAYTLINTFSSLSVEVASRLTTIAAAIATAVFLYLIGKRFLGKWGGLLSAFFYLALPFNIYFTRVVLPDPLGVTFGVAALWFFIKFIDGSKTVYLFASSVLFALMLLIKPYLGFYLIPAAYLAWEKYGLKNLFKKPLILKTVSFAILVLLPLAAWRIWEGMHPEGIPLFSWAFNGNGIRFRPSYWNWVYGERLGHLILGSFGIVPFIFGVLVNKNRQKGGDFIRWFLIGAFIYVTLVASANVMHDYYQIITIPAISMALASGSMFLYEQKVFNNKLARIILFMSVFVMFITGWYQIKGNYVINHPEIIEAGAAVDRLTPKNAIVVAPYSGDTAFLYHTKRYGWPAVDDSIENIIKKGASYYVSVDLNSNDTLNFQKKFEVVVKTDKYILLDLNKPIN